MDFFTQQDRAKQRTAQLLGLLLLAMAAMASAIYGVALLVEALWWFRPGNGTPMVWWQPQLFLWVFAGTAAVVSWGSYRKLRELSAGGGVVALMLGGRQILAARAQDREVMLLNVVEEMAIAAGMAVPFVFVLDREPGINAFAAGFSHEDAAVVVTHGALSLLTRDELQGVIAHEFSHLLNGDTRLNTRLIGLLHGITAVGGTGRLLMRLSFGGRRRRADVGLAALGAILWLIGSVGLLCGRLIRAAAMRQRELLADASAVQFTRNPKGLAGALKKIGGAAHGSWIETPQAEEIAHLFFGASEPPSWWSRLLASHPPLLARILRLDPDFSGLWLTVTPPPPSAVEVRQRHAAEVDARLAGGALHHSGNVARAVLVASGSHLSVGEADAMADDDPQDASHNSPVASPRRVSRAVSRAGLGATLQLGDCDAAQAQVGVGRALVAAVPEGLLAAAHGSFDAVALVFALLLDAEDELRRAQLNDLHGSMPAGVVRQAEQLLPLVAQLDPRLRLPLVELAVPALRQLSAAQLSHFAQAVQRLADADQHRSLFEYALQHLLLRRLVRPQQGRAAQLFSVAHVARAGSVVLSALAWVGHPADSEAATLAFQRGAASLPRLWQAHLTLLARQDCAFATIDAALDRLAQAAPVAKGQLLDACAICAMTDGRITVEEGELLRTLAGAVGCAAPPFLPTLASQPS